jgi:alkanesulfonate monooxygenase SsuD/methylene tetrahydromethanopterin reductase-like flavin-dependent oxidoreductase (luciferase family)
VDTVEVCRRAWTGRRFSYQGRVHAYDRVKVTPPPARPGGVPLLLGGFTPPALRRVGRIGDGYIRSRGGSIDDARRALALAEEGARAAGKDPASLGFYQLQNAFVWDGDDDPDERWAEIRPMVAHQTGVYKAWGAGQDTPADDRLEPPAGDDDALRALTPAGTPEQVSRALRPQLEAFGGRATGFHLIVRLHYPGMPFDTAARAFELFAERVLPALKGT